MTFMNLMSGKENIKIVNRLLFEEDVIKAVDRHTKDDDRLDDDISCILGKLKSPISINSKEVHSLIDNESTQKQRRVLLFENENLDLEQRGNRYYLSLYDKKGKFQREVTIDVKDDYNVGLGNCK